VDAAHHEVVDSIYTQLTGATRVFLRQTVSGLPVYNGELQVNINRDGRVMGVANAFLADGANALNTTTPALDAAGAVASAAVHLGLSPRDEISVAPIESRLMVLPIRQGEARLVWNFQIHTADLEHVYDFTVDAVSGKVWTRFDWVADGTYRVYEQPIESPNHTSPAPPADGRTLAVDPEDATASPSGWLAAPSSVMAGNNVHACADLDGNNVCDTPEPTCTGTTCDFAIDLTQAPSAYVPAAITNLFYWNNIIHDIQYQYGFDEPNGNFQEDNFGNGGLGSDSVDADAQNGGTCNPSFTTPPDGTNPRMQMFVCPGADPAHDSDLDDLVIVHEYAHGISNRLVGGPANTGCLENDQQPGEGISDFLGLIYTAEVGDAGDDSRSIATYLFGQPPTGPGLRPLPYTTDFAVNPRTYSDVATHTIPHGVGFIWASAAWEVYWELVNARGFDPDLYDALGTAGNQRAMLYLTEGLKNAACSPTFLDVRDGMLQAAMDNHGGEDVCTMWFGFARRGQGTDASTTGPDDHNPVDGFVLPPECRAIFDDGFESGDTSAWTATVP
jgi:extracellular elastinolytic metalloproteinase